MRQKGLKLKKLYICKTCGKSYGYLNPFKCHEKKCTSNNINNSTNKSNINQGPMQTMAMHQRRQCKKEYHNTNSNTDTSNRSALLLHTTCQHTEIKSPALTVLTPHRQEKCVTSADGLCERLHNTTHPADGNIGNGISTCTTSNIEIDNNTRAVTESC